MPPRRRQPAVNDPPLPGGYKVGEKVFLTAVSQTLSNGDKAVHGQQGEVTGPATVETHKGKGVCLLFPGNKGSIQCFLTTVRRLRAASAPICAPLATLPTPRASPPPPLPRRPSPHCMRSRSRRSPTPSAGVWGVLVRASGF